ncbi:MULTISPECIES: hypothetical protein [unclassified Pseudoalteromonas]|uniref:hypothetical protein n=1 Tax=unclassified Pseudoalteromonas TaxID=194690 RepID=UPI00301570B0
MNIAPTSPSAFINDNALAPEKSINNKDFSLAITSSEGAYMKAAKAAQGDTPESHINSYLMPYYEEAKKLAHQSMVGSGKTVGTREYNIELYREMMGNIMEIPIDVEITADEMNQAVLFNHLGLDFKEYKTLQARSELLGMLKQEIMEDGKLLRSDKDKLESLIADAQKRLEKAQEALLAGEDITEYMQQSRRAINDGFEQLGLGKVHPRDRIASM